ncbi:MAG: hypothetical protein P4L46_25515 [Fimbriimonas sp.]|nr:hypothetical protein [Fimbriimonas sp.]
MKRSYDATSDTPAIAQCFETPAEKTCPLLTEEGAKLKWCPRCGRPNRTIGVDHNMKFTMPSKTVKSKWFPLEVRGANPIRYEVSSASPTVRVVEQQQHGQDGFLVELQQALPQGSVKEIEVSIKTENGKRELDRLNKLSFEQSLTYPVTIRAIAPKIETDLQTAILHDRTRSRPIQIWYSGDVEELEVSIDVDGVGFGLFDARSERIRSKALLRSGEPFECFVARIDHETPYGAVKLSAPSCETVEVEVIWVDEKVTSLTPARYTVGVDFGTTGTSINVVEYTGDNERAYERAVPITDAGPVLEGDEMVLRRRWPTLIALVNSDRNGWLWGLEARAKSFDKDHFVIEGIKSRLRHGKGTIWVPEAGNEDHSVEMPVIEVVTWYFKQLRRLIEAQVPEIAEQVELGLPINIVFSLPVLDYNRDKTDYDRQREATLVSARKAFGEPYKIDTILEPEAAACYLVQMAYAGELQGLRASGKPYDVSVKHGETVMVYDSGGGTTDIIVGTLQINSGKLKLDVHMCERAVSDEKDGYGGVVYKDFAGRAVNDYFLEVLHQRTRDNKDDSNDLRSVVYDTEAQYFDDEADAIRESIKNGRFSWGTCQSRISSDFEDTKTKVSRDGIVSKIYGDDRLTVDRRFLDQIRRASVTTEQVEQIEHVLQTMESKDIHVSKVFLIGGNCELHALQEAIIEDLPESTTQIIVPTPKSNRGAFALNLFVPVGVCLANSVPRQLRPYTVEVREVLRNAEDRNPQRVVFPAGEVGERPIGMAFIEEPTLQIFAKLADGLERLLRTLAVPENLSWSSRVEAIFSMRGQELHVAWKPRIGPIQEEVLYLA